MSVELFRHLFLGPYVRRGRYKELPDLARRIEDAGWDGVAPGENAVHFPDPYVNMAVIACHTTRLRLTPAIAHPVGRHVSSAVAAIVGVQLASGGRASLTIGKGDGGVISLGMKPATVAAFETYVAQLQGFLRGEVVDLDGYDASFTYLPTDEVPKVPVVVAATGPKMIGVGARLADRITFSVGADPARMAWAVATARAAREAAGLDPAGLSLGAYVIMSAEREPSERTMKQVRSLASVHIRFGAYDERSRSSGSGGRPLASLGLSEEESRATASMVERYDNASHAHLDSPQATAIPDDFLRRFAIVGDPEHCAARLAELADLGLDHFVILPGLAVESEPEELEAAFAPIGSAVAPRFRARTKGAPCS